MVIYGVGLLAFCMLCGLICGRALGWLIGVDANVGGVGISMLLLIASCEFLRHKGRLLVASQQGIVFWSSIYIPIVVAMAATSDVRSAITGGPLAILAGVLATVLCFALVPVMDRMFRKGQSQDDGGLAKGHGDD